MKKEVLKQRPFEPSKPKCLQLPQSFDVTVRHDPRAYQYTSAQIKANWDSIRRNALVFCMKQPQAQLVYLPHKETKIMNGCSQKTVIQHFQQTTIRPKSLVIMDNRSIITVIPLVYTQRNTSSLTLPKQHFPSLIYPPSRQIPPYNYPSSIPIFICQIMIKLLSFVGPDLIAHSLYYIMSQFQSHDREYIVQDDDEHTEEVFSRQFKVDPMINPTSFLPQYSQNRHYEPTANQKCLSCCGDLCLMCSAPFGLCGCMCCCGYQLPTSYVGLVETFGKFSRLLKPGFNLINPCSEQVSLVDLRLKVMNVGRHPTQTKDNVKLDIDASVSYRVVNPIISHYVLGLNLNRALTELTISSLRDSIGQYTLDHVLIERIALAERAKEIVMKGIPPGIRVENVFIDQIIIPAQVEKDLTSAARQKRLSQANIINSKADVQSADLMRQSADLMSTKAAMQIRYLQMVQKLGEKGVLVMMDIGIDKKGYKDSGK